MERLSKEVIIYQEKNTSDQRANPKENKGELLFPIGSPFFPGNYYYGSPFFPGNITPGVDFFRGVKIYGYTGLCIKNKNESFGRF